MTLPRPTTCQKCKITTTNITRHKTRKRCKEQHQRKRI